MKAVLFISHGSRSPELLREVKDTIREIEECTGASIYEYGFLELNRPTIKEGFENCVKRGAKEIIIVLNFLNSGKHVNQDIPDIINNLSSQYTDVKVTITEPVGQHKDIIQVFKNMINEHI